MVAQSELLEAWAGLLHYPLPADAERLGARIQLIRGSAPEVGEELDALESYFASHRESELEEVFTRTFDSNAERALEVGWHLHGENYARGVFMVRMRKLLRDAGVEESSELPDHLSHVLLVMAHSDSSVSQALASGVVTPALNKIIEGFGDSGNPYLGVITGLLRYLDAQSPPETKRVQEHRGESS